MASAQAASQYGYPLAHAKPSHARLPSIQNILSPQNESPDRERDFAPKSYTHDPFRPSARLPPSDHMPRHFQPHPPHMLQTTSLAASAENASDRPTTSSALPVVEDHISAYRHASPTPASSSHPGPPSPYSGHGPSPYHTSPSSSDYRSAQSANASSDRCRSPRLSLPRQMIPGVGECFIYSDGSYLPCQINNEPVNPEFGVTKAGKPRKRLAQACMTCREKKIKCQPGDPKCVQCTKVNRECKRPSTHTSKDSLPDVPVTVGHASVPRNEYAYKPASPLPPANKLPSQHEVEQEGKTESLTKYESHRLMSTYDCETAPAPKRQRIYVEELPAKPGRYDTGEGLYGSHPPGPPSLPFHSSSFDMDPVAPDPFLKDPDLALEFLELYFEHRGRGPYSVFPRNDFIRWALTCRNKSSDDIMLLYIVMAVGSRFSTNRMKRNTGQRFAKKAAFLERERIGELCLQLAQTRLYFLLFYFAEGKNAMGWEHLSSGLSACIALNFNTEQGVTKVPSDPSSFEYGLNREQLIECRRRTFFAGYCMDRFVGHNSGHMGLLNDDDLFVRLPGLEASFDRSHQGPPAPYFCEGQLAEQYTSAPGEMALLVPLVAMWGQVVAYTYRSYHHPSKARYLEKYQAHSRDIYERLGQWETALPEHLRFSTANTSAAVSRGCMTAYFVFHAIKFVTLIKLNRNAHVRLLPMEMVRENIAQTMIEANNLLSIVAELCRAMDAMKSSATADLENALSQPFPGYAVMAACEVVTSGGVKQKVSHIKSQLVDAKQVLEKIGRYWFASTKQQNKVEKRLIKFGGMDLAALSTGVEAGLWRIPADKDANDFFPEDYDLIHGTPDAVFYDAVRLVN